MLCLLVNIRFLSGFEIRTLGMLDLFLALNISASVLDELVVTDTIPLSEAARRCRQIRVLSVAELLGETMRRIRDEESVSSLVVD